MLPELSNKKKSIVLTSLLFALLFVLFYWLKLANNTPISLLEGGGGGGEVAVNFGDSELGSGTNFTSEEAVTTAAATPEESIEYSRNGNYPRNPNGRQTQKNHRTQTGCKI